MVRHFEQLAKTAYEPQKGERVLVFLSAKCCWCVTSDSFLVGALLTIGVFVDPRVCSLRDLRDEQ